MAGVLQPSTKLKRVVHQPEHVAGQQFTCENHPFPEDEHWVPLVGVLCGIMLTQAILLSGSFPDLNSALNA